mmetsp:Transcript_8198/g.24601  ORF Transcript_8198/g.24601 Transcript_8198/m.24601 type:complete len:215 (-) Transcript_8198:162-806(-)
MPAASPPPAFLQLPPLAQPPAQAGSVAAPAPRSPLVAQGAPARSSISVVAREWKASKIGLYPVHRHRFPSNLRSTSSAVGFGFSWSKAYMFTTKPGVHMPHWDALQSAIFFWMGWYPSSSVPTPSTVVTLQPPRDTKGVKHELIGRPFFHVFPSCDSSWIMIVHAPQPPSAHERFVPVYPPSWRSQSTTRIFGSGSATSTVCPFSTKVRGALVG